MDITGASFISSMCDKPVVHFKWRPYRSALIPQDPGYVTRSLPVVTQTILLVSFWNRPRYTIPEHRPDRATPLSSHPCSCSGRAQYFGTCRSTHCCHSSNWTMKYSSRPVFGPQVRWLFLSKKSYDLVLSLRYTILCSFVPGYDLFSPTINVLNYNYNRESRPNYKDSLDRCVIWPGEVPGSIDRWPSSFAQSSLHRAVMHHIPTVMSKLTSHSQRTHKSVVLSMNSRYVFLDLDWNFSSLLSSTLSSLRCDLILIRCLGSSADRCPRSFTISWYGGWDTS